MFDIELNRWGTGSIKFGFHEKFNKPKDVIPLWVADMDFASPPEVIVALQKMVWHGIFGYSYATEDYYESIRNWFKKRYGWVPKPEWDQQIPGVMFGVAAAIRAVTKEGEAVLIQQPVYPPFEEVIHANRRKLIVNELLLENGKYVIDFDAFEQQIIRENVKVFLLCSPHNPVARVWTENELRKMGEIALKHGVKVIADEIHADFTLFGNRHFLFPSLGEEFSKNTVLCTSPSKTFNLMGLQTANIWAEDPSWRKAIQEQCLQFHWHGINAAALEASAAAYRFGKEWFDALSAYLEENVRFVNRRLKEMNSGIWTAPHEGTYLMWLDCRKWGLTERNLDLFWTEKARLWLNPGIIFGKGGAGFMRMNIASPRSILMRAMDQLEMAMNSGVS